MIKFGKSEYLLSDGSVVIAAITSCTNTSNPSVMLGAGLVAKKAVEKGLDDKTLGKNKSWHPDQKLLPLTLIKPNYFPFLNPLDFM